MPRNKAGAMKGTVAFAHFSGVDEEKDPVSELSIVDKVSGVEIVSIPLTLVQFGNLVRGGRTVDVMIDWNVKRLGWKYESKRVLVPLDTEKCKGEWKDGNHVLTAAGNKYLDQALAHYEIDGWKADRKDVLNHHRRGKDGVHIAFRRWVAPTHGPAQCIGCDGVILADAQVFYVNSNGACCSTECAACARSRDAAVG